MSIHQLKYCDSFCTIYQLYNVVFVMGKCMRCFLAAQYGSVATHIFGFVRRNLN